MARPLIPDDDPQQFARLEDRVRRLEQSTRHRVVRTTSSSIIELGSFDGDNITGIRLSGDGIVNNPAGVNTVMRMQPNSSNFLVGIIAHRFYTATGPSYPIVEDTVVGGGAMASTSPAIALTDFNVINSSVSFDGILFTNRDSNAARHYHGTYMNQDMSSDGHRRMFVTLAGTFWDSTTPFTSIRLALDAGTFTGRVTMEIVP